MQQLVTMPVVIESGTAGKRSNLLRNIKAGLFPPGIKIGRSLVWPESEIIALQKALIAGKAQDQIRALVVELVAKRKASDTVVES
jgi:prophage regulatory protein